MSKITSLIKWVAILGGLALAAYVLYQVIKAIKAGASAGQAAREAIAKAWVSSKSALTPGWSSLVPKESDMQPEMASRYAQIKAGEPNLNTPNPNAPWWQKSVADLFPSWLGGTKGTPQTLGSSQQSVNVNPIDIRTLTPSNQRGEVVAPINSQTGSVDGQANMGTGTGNSLPPASVTVGPVHPVIADVNGLAALNYTAPGASASASGATGGLNLAPPSGEPNYNNDEQNSFIGQ
jgi:hypothetical protein